MGQPLSFFGPTQGIVQPGGLVSYRKGGIDFVLDPDVTAGWDFAADKTLIDRKNALQLDFTRASIATFFDVAGIRQTAQIDVARFGHDRISHVSLGLLMEEARTNEFLNSDVPVTQDVTTTAQAYTVSMFGTGSVTLSGTATGVATDGSPLTVTASAGTLTLTVAGGPDEVQLEAGLFASSFIKTAGVSVTRAQDVCNTADVSWYNQPAGTLYIKITSAVTAQITNDIMTISDNSAVEFIKFRRNSARDARFQITQSSLVQVDLTEFPSTTFNAPGTYKLAAAFQFNDAEHFIEGVRVGTGDQTVIMPTGISRLHVGSGEIGGLSWNGHINVLAYANVRKDNQFLEDITTP